MQIVKIIRLKTDIVKYFRRNILMIPHIILLLLRDTHLIIKRKHRIRYIAPPCIKPKFLKTRSVDLCQ